MGDDEDQITRPLEYHGQSCFSAKAAAAQGLEARQAQYAWHRSPGAAGPAEAQGRGNSKNVGIASMLRSSAGANKHGVRLNRPRPMLARRGWSRANLERV